MYLVDGVDLWVLSLVGEATVGDRGPPWGVNGTGEAFLRGVARNLRLPQDPRGSGRRGHRVLTGVGAADRARGTLDPLPAATVSGHHPSRCRGGSSDAGYQVRP